MEHLSVTLSGTEAAQLSGAAFALGHWPFEDRHAKQIAATFTREEAQDFEVFVFERWTALLRSHGLWESTPETWTRELIQKRSSVWLELALTAGQVTVAVVALRAAAAEFENNWRDFRIAIPGALDWYDTDAAAFSGLATKLERLIVPTE